MNKKILFVFVAVVLLALLVGAYVDTDDYILLEFKYEQGNLVLVDKSLEKGNSPSLNHFSRKQYEFNLLTGENVLYSADFNPVLLYTDGYEQEINGDTFELEDASFFLNIPSIKDAEKIEILKDGVKIFEEEVYDVGSTSCRIK